MVRELVQCNTLEKRLFIGLFIAFFVLGGLYVYLVNETVRNVVERRILEEDITVLASDVADLELVHVELNNAVTVDRAYELGFQEVTGVTYLTPDSLALSPVQITGQ